MQIGKKGGQETRRDVNIIAAAAFFTVLKKFTVDFVN